MSLSPADRAHRMYTDSLPMSQLRVVREFEEAEAAARAGVYQQIIAAMSARGLESAEAVVRDLYLGSYPRPAAPAGDPPPVYTVALQQNETLFGSAESWLEVPDLAEGDLPLLHLRNVQIVAPQPFPSAPFKDTLFTVVCEERRAEWIFGFACTGTIEPTWHPRPLAHVNQRVTYDRAMIVRYGRTVLNRDVYHLDELDIRFAQKTFCGPAASAASAA